MLIKLETFDQLNHDFSSVGGGAVSASMRDAPRVVELRRTAQIWLLGVPATVDAIGLATWLVCVIGRAAGTPLMLGILLFSVVAITLMMQAAQFYAVDTLDKVRRSAMSAVSFAACALPVVVSVSIVAVGGREAAIFTVAALALTAVSALARATAAHVVDRLAHTLQERILLITPPALVRTVLDSRPETAARVELIAVGDGEMPQPPVASLFCTEESRLSDLEQLFDVARDVDRIVIATEDSRSEWLGSVLRNLEQLPNEISLVVVSRLASKQHDMLARANCVVLHEPAIVGFGAIMKRTFDVVVASAALLLLAPLLVFVAILVRLESPGPALFKQPRWGWGGTPFRMLKFRTMWDGSPAGDGSVQASRNDLRVTRLGRFLRKTSIDEFPQLINVLNGTMSIVGPRPHPVGLNHKYMFLIRRYPARHRVRPGITGWAQVNGARGETKTVAAMQKRVDLDLDYIRRQSLGLDLWIILRTVHAVVGMVNAY